MRQLICGKNSVLDAIKNKLPIKVIYTTRENELQFATKIKKVNKNFLDKLTNENHQGFVAELESFHYQNLQSILEDKPQKVLVLDHIQDPHNLGSILRNANAFGIKHIVIPKKRSASINATVIKVSSGGYVGLKIIRVTSLMNAINVLKVNGFWIYATGLKKSTNFKKVSFNFPLALVFGNESKGVSGSILKHADKIISIKIVGTVKSLNVATSSGIILSEM